MRSVTSFATLWSVAAGVLAGSLHADTVAQWDFNGPSALEVPGGHVSPSPSFGNGIASLVGGATAPEAFSSGAASGGSSDPAGGPPPNYAWQTTGYASQGQESGQRGVQFSVSTIGHSDIVVRWDQRHSNTASRFAQFQYSIDGMNFTSEGLANDGIFEADAGGDTWYNYRTVDLTEISAVNDNPNFAFRIVAIFDPSTPGAYSPSRDTSTYAPTGTWRFDMVMVFYNGHGADPVPDWPAVFDPYRLVGLNLSMDNADWETVQNDESLSIYVPAMFWTDGEVPILVGVRRKSADPMGHVPGFTKVALKVDFNRYVSGQSWRRLRKLSLETGDDEDVLAEGLSWRYHHQAAGPEGYNYAHSPGMASWITLKINGVQTGVYLSVEERDRRFLQNRGLWVGQQTWMYKVNDMQGADIEAGPDSGEHSPLYQLLCYAPFRAPPACGSPSNEYLVNELPGKIDMQAMLTLGGVCAFTVGNDLILPKGKNFRFADFGPSHSQLLRQYYPWDLDATIKQPHTTIYPTGSPYATLLLGVPEFRAQYSQILNDLICGPIAAEHMLAFLNAIEPVLVDALDADPNRNFSGSTAQRIDSLRNWVTLRTSNVINMLEGWQPCPEPGAPGDINGDGVVDVSDLLILLAAWGPCDDPNDCPADLDNNGVVDVSDLLILLANWG